MQAYACGIGRHLQWHLDTDVKLPSFDNSKMAAYKMAALSLKWLYRKKGGVGPGGLLSYHVYH